VTTIFQATILILISLVAAIFGAISGGGGGNLVVPAIVSTVNVNSSVLVGSVFCMYLVSSIAGLYAYNRKGLVDYRSGIILSIPCIPGVVIGTLAENAISDFEFKFGLGILTVILALMMFYRKREKTPIESNKDSVSAQDLSGTLTHEIENHPSKSSSDSNPVRVLTDKSGRVFSYSPNLALGLLINFFAGLLAGIFGAGAGAIIIPTTILFVRLPGHIAIATTRIVLMMLDAAALTTHIGIGTINLTYALILSVGAIVGTFIGARIAFRISPAVLTKIIASIFLVLGAYILLSIFG
jgi:uncharacterized membrane protein YfcA